MEKINKRKERAANRAAQVQPQPVGSLTQKVNELIDDDQIDAFPEPRNR
jgi:hypothetical protein